VITWTPSVEHWRGPKQMGYPPVHRRLADEVYPNPYVWLMIRRKSGRVVAYTSNDGEAWKVLRTEKDKFPAEVFVGPMVINTGNAPVTADFESVVVIDENTPPESK